LKVTNQMSVIWYELNYLIPNSIVDTGYYFRKAENYFAGGDEEFSVFPILKNTIVSAKWGYKIGENQALTS